MRLLAASLFGIALVSSSLAATVQKDVSYLGPERKEKLDVYLPPGNFARPLPAILLIHGGGWIGGDKADARGKSIATTLADHGYAVFAVNYLLGAKDGPPPWPQNIDDCKSALRFIRKEVVRFAVDPARIGVMGESAGGQLALLLGATAHADAMNQGGLYVEQSNAVACIVDFYGAADTHDSHFKAAFSGATDAETEENLRRSSPATWFDAATPPTFIAHGTADPSVPVAVSRGVAARLKELGVDVTYVEIEGAVHSFDLQPPQKDLRPEVFAFLDKHLGNQLSP